MKTVLILANFNTDVDWQKSANGAVVEHASSEIGVDSFQADRSPTHMYRTAPLAGLWSQPSRGFYHDGRFQTLDEVIRHYDQHLKLQLTDQESKDLVEFLKSLYSSCELDSCA